MQAIAQRSACHSCVVPFSSSTRRRLTPCRAADQQQQQQQEEAPAQPSSTEPAGQPKVLREFRAFGGKVLETDEKLTGPEDQPDFWEGEKFDAFGKLVERYFLPGLVVLGVICGAIAARSYEEGATAYIKTPGSPDDEMIIIDRSTVESVLLGGSQSAPSTSP